MYDFKENKKKLEQVVKQQEPLAQKLAEHIEGTIIVISDYTKLGYKGFKKELIETYYDYIKQGFEYKFLREALVPFRFVPEGDIYRLQLRHFITNIMMWSPIVKLNPEDINETCLIDCHTLNNRLIKSFIDYKIIAPYKHEVSNVKMNELCDDLIHELGRVSTDFNIMLGLTMNLETFMDIANRHPEFDDIIRTKFDESTQPSDVEKMNKGLTDQAIKIIMNDTQHNHLKPIFLAGTGIKDGQFKEFAVNGGYKPDLSGSTIPVVVNSSLLIDGYNDPMKYYIDSIGGRKALIMNSSVMGTAGHFARLMMLLCSDVVLSETEDCGTLHSVMLNVTSEKFLKKFKMRYYRLPHERQYKVLTGNEKELVGQTIFVRSPAKCALDDGVCHKCYGDLYYTNIDLNSAGANAATEISEPISQKILSSKHLLNTDSEKIEFNDRFYDFFATGANEVILDNTTNEKLDNYTLLLRKEYVLKLEEVDESGITSYTKIFHVRDNKTGEITDIFETHGKELYLSPELEELIKASTSGRGRGRKKKQSSEFIEIPIIDIDFGSRLFLVEIINNELTKPLYDIMGILDSEDKREKIGITSIDTMIQTLIDLFTIAEIPSDAVHGEIIVRALVRNSNDILKRPNFFSYGVDKETRIMTIKSALRNHPSITVSLSFQELGKQLVSPVTFRKTQGSFLDPYFRETL